MIRSLVLLLVASAIAHAAKPLSDGVWRSVKQSRTGRQTVMRFVDSSVVVTTGIFIAYRYDRRGAHLRMRQVRPAGATRRRSYALAMNGDTMRLILDAGDTTTLVRSAPADRRDDLLGRWKRLGVTKGEAWVTFAPKGKAHLDWIYHSDTSHVVVTPDSLVMTMHGGTVLRMRYRLTARTLQLFHEKGEHPIYRREHDE